MKTPLLRLVVAVLALFLTSNLMAAGGSAVLSHSQRMPLCYPMSDRATSPTLPRAALLQETGSSTTTFASITHGSADTQTASVETSQTSLQQHITGIKRKFSFANLLGGSVYDFMRKNDLKLTLGSPAFSNPQKNAFVKCEEPFSLSLLFRFKM